MLLGGIGEIASRIFSSPPSPYYGITEMDEQLGWRPKEHFQLQRTIYDSQGDTYEALFQTTKGGFREFGDVNSERFKVLFLGDSYTQSVEVSNEQTFYRRIADSLPVEVFAFGQAGYGNLQELMILEEVVEEIDPDLLVLQVCDNDFIDNHFQLEWEALYSPFLRRPYLGIDDSIQYRLPVPQWQAWLANSQFLRVLGTRISWLRFPIRKNIRDTTIAEYHIGKYGTDYQPYAKAVKITKSLFQKIQDRLGSDRGFFVFSAYLYPPQMDDHRQMCEELGIPYHESPAQAVMDANIRGENVYAWDRAHWNPDGQDIVARQLRPLIFQQLQAWSKQKEEDPYLNSE